MLFRHALEQREQLPVGLSDPKLLEWLGIDPNTVSVRGKNALKEVTVYACIKILSEAVAKLPMKVYQETAAGIAKANTHSLHRLLKLRPNPYMAVSVFLRTVEVQRNLYGNAFVSPEFDTKGRVIGLYPLDAGKVEVWVDDVGLLSSKNQMWYIVNVGGERRRVHSDEIIHLKSLTTDGIVGIAPLDYLRYLVENGANATQFINRFYRQGLGMKGIVHYVGDLNPAAQETFRQKFESMAAGLNNWHRTAMLPVGYQFQPVQLTMADAQFLENTEQTIRQLANAFGVKMHQLNDLSRATHTNIEEQNRSFYSDTLQAILTEYEQEFTYKLLLDSELQAGYYCKFNVDTIVRSDIKTRYESYRVGIQGGFLMPNEVRALEELPSAAGGDVLLVNGNAIPITMAGQQHKKGGGKAGQGKAEPES